MSFAALHWIFGSNISNIFWLKRRLFPARPVSANDTSLTFLTPDGLSSLLLFDDDAVGLHQLGGLGDLGPPGPLTGRTTPSNLFQGEAEAREPDPPSWRQIRFAGSLFVKVEPPPVPRHTWRFPGASPMAKPLALLLLLSCIAGAHGRQAASRAMAKGSKSGSEGGAGSVASPGDALLAVGALSGAAELARRAEIAGWMLDGARWKILGAAAMALNLWAVGIPGRLDGEAAEQLQKEKKDGGAAPTPAALTGRSMFTPSGYAFAIWGPIFAGETLFHFGLQFLPGMAEDTKGALAKASPWWALACASQAIWCGTFRPRFRRAGPQYLLISAACLGVGAASLGRWHGIVREFAICNPGFRPLLMAGVLPMTMHFGWLLAASLVNLNGSLAYAPSVVKDAGMSAVAVVSAVAGAAVASWASITRRAPTVGAVGAWALVAVANDMKRRLQGDRKGYATQGAAAVRYACLGGASVCLTAAVAAAAGGSALDSIAVSC